MPTSSDLKNLSLEPGRCLVIAEIAQAHDGSLGTAHALIDAVAATGADAIKFQTHIAAAESTPGEPWRIQFSPQDETRFDYWKRMEFSESQWHGLKQHAEQVGLFFLSSPFSDEAAELLMRVGVAAWKIASGEVTNLPLLERLAATGQLCLLSTGMHPLSDIDAAAKIIRAAGAPLAVLQCTTAYPCPPEQIGINVLAELLARYQCPVGLSDHSGTIYPGLAAATLGASVVEVHVTLSRQAFGPDVAASLTTGELEQLVSGVRFIEKMNAHPIDKESMAEALAPLRNLFGKSVVARVDLQPGIRLQRQHLALKKPGTGIPAARIDEIINRSVRRPIPANTLLQDADLEHES